MPNNTCAPVASSDGLVDLGPSLDGAATCPDFGGTCPDPATWPAGPLLPNPGYAAVNTVDTNGMNLFDGKWIKFTLQIPNDYGVCTPAPCTDPYGVHPNDQATWYWRLAYTTTTTVHDSLTVDVSAGAIPVHLLPPA
jgi:hypothetical protein